MFDIIARDDERCTKQTAKQEKGINYYIRDQNVRLICGGTPETDVVGVCYRNHIHFKVMYF
jgi:hypothetical protein